MEIDYPHLSEEQINNIKKVLIPILKQEDINDIDELEDAESDGFEWLELFEDYIEPDNLSHITNKELGLDENATPEDRDKVFGEFGASSEWTMVTTLVWEWLETERWEIIETKIIDSKITIPDWFKGKVYDKGDVVENSDGVKTELNNVELSLYKRFKDDRFAVNMYMVDSSLLTESEFEERKDSVFKIVNWFKENNNIAFNNLF